MQHTKLILGPPGTGKTTRLLKEVELALQGGTPPNRVAFVSFTRSAIREARDRARDQFGYDKDELPYFRTLHSLAYHQLGLRRSDVFGHAQLAHLAELTGEELTGKLELDAPTLGERGDALLFLDQFSRSTRTSLEEAWREHNTPLDWWRLRRFVEAYTALRRSLGLLDFTDMLERALEVRARVDVDVVFIDECQDLTRLQWLLVREVFFDVPRVVICGDDDQAIFHWAGASPEDMLAFQGEREVLARSYRLPRTVHALAAGVAGQISRRFPKQFEPSRDERGVVREGTVEWLSRPDEVDLSAGSWLLLARTRRQLAPLAELARGQGVTYTLSGESSVDPVRVEEIREYEKFRGGDPTLPLWHDALTDIPLEDREYMLSCLRRGESLTREPRVRIETIHGAKGLEADNVLVVTDLNERVRRGMELDPDAELRVLYVAVTRARERLYLVESMGRISYQL